MPETKIDSAVSSNLTNAMTDFSVGAQQTDGATGQDETEWMNTHWSIWFGYYKTIPELKSTIDTRAKWVIGKEGYEADPKTKKIMDNWIGWGKDTPNQLIKNMVRTYYVGGDFFAEIIKSGNKVINLKPLDPGSIKIIVNGKGILQRYEQVNKIEKRPPTKFKPEEIFHLANNRFADEIHGTSIIPAIKDIILMRNEAMADNKLINHRFAYPRWILHLDTDDATEIAEFKRKYDKANASGENLYVPKDVVVPELVAVAPQATINLLPWIQDLTGYFHQATNTPEVIVGTATKTTEAAAKVLILGYEQSVRDDQLFIVENFKSQLKLEIKLKFPTPIEQEMATDERKDGQVNKPMNVNPTKHE